MKRIHGTCGHCGGAVTTPSLWMGINPPTPTCEVCGRVPVEAHGPVLPMADKPKYSKDTLGDIVRKNS